MQAPHSPRQLAVLTLVRELEHHVSSGGWDGPIRLFALVRTADALERDAGLAERLPIEVVAAACADGEHLTAVEQDDLPPTDTIEELLGSILWPETVDGAALVVERIVLPPGAEDDLPTEAAASQEWVAAHPGRRDLRLAAAVLRDGTGGSAIRARDHDTDAEVAVGVDLVPQLIQSLSATLAG